MVNPEQSGTIWLGNDLKIMIYILRKWITVRLKGGIMMKLVLLSGGVDSSTALALAKATDTDILAITFTYNQQHEQMELLAAQKVSEYYQDRKSTRLNSSHVSISYAVFCLKKKT